MRVAAQAARVVAFWGLLNAVGVIVLIGFGEQSVVIAIYAGAAALVELIAAAVWLGARRQERRDTWRLAANGDAVLIFAGGVVFAALALAFYPPLAIAAVVPFIAAALRELSTRRGGLWG